MTPGPFTVTAPERGVPISGRFVSGKHRAAHMSGDRRYGVRRQRSFIPLHAALTAAEWFGLTVMRSIGVPNR